MTVDEMIGRLLAELATDDQTLHMLQSAHAYGPMSYTRGHRDGVAFALRVLQQDPSVAQ